MTRTGYTHIEVLLDRSGSMDTIQQDMEGGFNTFLAEQRKIPGPATIGLAQFDTEYDTVYSMLDIRYAPPLHLDPRGGTALIDSMVRSIDALGVRLKEMPEGKRPEKVIFVVITDGLENQSRRHTRRDVMRRVTAQRETYGWEFIYLGANQDAIAEARSYGISAHSTLDYRPTGQSVGSTYSSLSANVIGTRTTGASVTFTPDQREDAQK